MKAVAMLDPREYHALTDGAGIVRLPDRTLIELAGRDRAAFLHNFTTNDIRRLQPGDGCETFVTSVQGKILGHVLVACGHESLVLSTVPGQAEKLLTHLDRYLIREEVSLHDRSTQWGELLLSGARSRSLLKNLLGTEPPTAMLGSADVAIGGRKAVVQRVAMAGPEGFLIRAETDNLDAIAERLESAGAVACSQETYDVARIEAGWPLYDVDVTDANLPQEVARDREAISFTKGCYLGQETVARIDALGHVNRTLCKLRFSGVDVPPCGTQLTSDGMPVGEVTSAAYSPRDAAPIALAYVRRGHNAVGTPLDSSHGPAAVVAF